MSVIYRTINTYNKELYRGNAWMLSHGHNRKTARFTMIDKLKLVMIPAFLSIIRGAPGQKPDDNYRLPKNCTPVYYDLSIILDQQIFSGNSHEFHGQVSVSFICSTSGRTIQLHADKKFINISTLRINGMNLYPEEYSIDSETNILKIRSKEPISARNKNTLYIVYKGKINDEDSGLHRSDYLNGKVRTYMVSTNFEPTNARRMFPCFDEPGMKARFHVAVTLPKSVMVFFNTKVEHIREDNIQKTVKFLATPVMSTYLIALVAADYDCTNAEKVREISIRICSRKGNRKQRQLAKDFAPKSLSKLIEFTNLNYGNYMKKLDLITIPDVSFIAMENWGLITFMDNYLLWDSEESSVWNEQNIAITITHEITHQWFGNLVTLQWWSETFLNEGFAKYFEYHATDEIRPEWELKKQYVPNIVQVAMVEDGRKDFPSLSSNCSTPTEIQAKFGPGSYNKGSSIIAMVQHFMGEKYFRKGLQYYLNKYKTGTVTSENVWSSLQKHVKPEISKLPASISDVMHNWIELSGFPVVHVKQDGLNIKLTQERFLVEGKDNTTKWYIPISYTTSSQSHSKFETTDPTLWLTPKLHQQTLTLSNESDWIVLNNKVTAYYRTNYDNQLWGKIRDALMERNHGDIPEVNRAQIVDDLFNLAKASMVHYSKAFKILNFLKNDYSYYPWHSAFTGFHFLIIKTSSNIELMHAIQNDVLRLMGNLYRSVSYSTSRSNTQNHINSMKQSVTMYWACRLGNKDCLLKIKNLFDDLKHNGTSVSKNLKKAVYCNVLRYSNDTQDWDFLWTKYLTTDLATKKAVILKALSCTRDRKLLKRYLETSMVLKNEDAIDLYQWICKENSDISDFVLDFVLDNYDQLAERFRKENALGHIIEDIGMFLSNQKEIKKLEDFKNSKDLPEKMRISVKKAIGYIKEGMEWFILFGEELGKYYGIPTRKTNIQKQK